MAADDASDIGIRLRVLASQIYDYGTQTDWLKLQCFPETATGEYLDRHASQRNITRKGESKAVGTLCFSVSEPSAENIAIPEGTVVASNSGIRYKTVASAVLESGKTEVSVKAEACAGGTQGNAASGTVTAPVNPPEGIGSVTNPAPFTGGRAAETDKQLRKRLLTSYSDMPNGANASFYREIALENPQVASANVVPAFPDKFYTTVYIRSLNGEEDEDLRAAVEYEIDRRCSVGVGVLVRYGSEKFQNIKAAVEVMPGYDKEQTLDECYYALEDVILNLSLGEDLLRADLNDALYHVPGVKNYRITEPSDDVYPGASIQLIPGDITVESLL